MRVERGRPDRMSDMYYRIVQAPPGFPPSEQFFVVAYETLAYESSVKGSTRRCATLEDARHALPSKAVRLPFEPDHQMLELWEVPR